jgi:hypothetical protein
MFEISFDESTFKDRWLENQPEIYLIVRNVKGQILHGTDTIDSRKSLKITMNSLERKSDLPNIDPCASNVNRTISALRSLADVTTFSSYYFDGNLKTFN